jgi:predicted phosphate transport protein (TIGR00153 family)
MFFNRKEKQVRNFMKEHLEKVRECLELFEKTIRLYLDKSLEEADRSSYMVHKKEHEADECRRKILAKLAEGAFLPFFREDFISIVELVDKIANRAKTVTQTMVLEMPKVPDEMKEQMKELAKTVIATLEPLMEILDQNSLDMESTAKLIGEISCREQDADSIEFKLLRRVFREIELPTADKIILANFVRTTSEVADAVENVGDRIQILISKQAI